MTALPRTGQLAIEWAGDPQFVHRRFLEESRCGSRPTARSGLPPRRRGPELAADLAIRISSSLKSVSTISCASAVKVEGIAASSGRSGISHPSARRVSAGASTIELLTWSIGPSAVISPTWACVTRPVGVITRMMEPYRIRHKYEGCFSVLYSMAKQIALITGITGQDGSYLAELLLSKGYEVHGIIRRSSSFNTGRIDRIFDRLKLHYGDLTEPHGLSHIIHQVRPTEVYNLAAQSHVKVSFELPGYTAQAAGMGVLNLLEAIRVIDPSIRLYQASSSEMFGSSVTQLTDGRRVQNESTSFQPRSPYAAAKVFGHHMTVNYREAYGLHASSGILFNHESPRRGETFVTRKITRAVVNIYLGHQKELRLGNLKARRDWGHAEDYVQAMWLMLQQPKGGDYVVATGETHTVEEFVSAAFGYFNMDWKNYVVIDEKYFRPTEVDYLCGDPSKAKKVLGWTPRYTFKGLVDAMMKADHDALNTFYKS
jgi:GDPmannose 4,6-dehydratase